MEMFMLFPQFDSFEKVDFNMVTTSLMKIYNFFKIFVILKFYEILEILKFY
jgi:hypothetical protein